MRSTLVLFNPASRCGRQVAAKAERLLARGEGGSSSSWVRLGDLEGAEPPCERLIAIGGDGTINAAASWLHRRGSSCPIAIIPAGTGNNLARGLGLPLDTEAACQVALLSPRMRGLDAVLYQAGGESTPRLMVQTAALGFPAEIAARYDALRRRRWFRWIAAPTGPYVYRLLALAGLAAQKLKERRGAPLLRVCCRFQGEVIDEDLLAVFIGNERSLGGDFHPCPRTEVDDGALDLCLIRAGTAEGYLRLFRRVVEGKHLSLDRAVIYRQTPGPLEVTLSTPTPFLADGDLWVRSDSYRLEVLPRRFAVVIG